MNFKQVEIEAGGSDDIADFKGFPISRISQNNELSSNITIKENFYLYIIPL